MLFSFLTSLPDGRLRITFCDVGQGDAAYVRFPDGRDMLIDGGPGEKVLGCLGKAMPFWDRSIDLVVLTHPQKDHMGGLASVFTRYRIGQFVHSAVVGLAGYDELMAVVDERAIPTQPVVRGDRFTVGDAALTVLWPSEQTLASIDAANTLGASVDLNDASVVVHLSYGEFDALFPGDADTRVAKGFVGTDIGGDPVEVVKVPHHGSRTGFSDAFLSWLRPELAVISVGKNSYGHPAEDVLARLGAAGIPVVRTDRSGDITILTDGIKWEYAVSRYGNEE